MKGFAYDFLALPDFSSYAIICAHNFMWFTLIFLLHGLVRLIPSESILLLGKHLTVNIIWIFRFRWFKHAGESFIKIPFFGAVSYITLAVSPFCIAFSAIWAVYRQRRFAWIGQDILVRSFNIDFFLVKPSCDIWIAHLPPLARDFGFKKTSLDWNSLQKNSLVILCIILSF